MKLIESQKQMNWIKKVTFDNDKLKNTKRKEEVQTLSFENLKRRLVESAPQQLDAVPAAATPCSSSVLAPVLAPAAVCVLAASAVHPLTYCHTDVTVKAPAHVRHRAQIHAAARSTATSNTRRQIHALPHPAAMRSALLKSAGRSRRPHALPLAPRLPAPPGFFAYCSPLGPRPPLSLCLSVCLGCR